jgi:cysteine desulfurase
MRQIYLDYAGTAPVSAQHYERVIAELKKVDGNPSSIHSFGREAKVALENCRSDIAAMFGASDQEIIFTSGGTESNNLAIQGVVGAAQGMAAERPSIAISSIEHSSIAGPAELLAERNLCQVASIAVDRQGYIDEARFADKVTSNTVFVGIIHVNNEVGTIQNLQKLASIAKSKNPNVHFHADCVQALGKVDLTWIGNSQIDSAAVSGHKIGGFKGTGALFLRRARRLNALIAGGGQERARRAGTENMPGIVSFGLRARDLKRNPDWLALTAEIHRMFLTELGALPNVVIHGDPKNGASTIVNFHAQGIPGEDILLNLDLEGIAVSAGSACSSGSSRPSKVLSALGYSDWEAANSIRLSFGEHSTPDEATRAIQALKKVLTRTGHGRSF